MKKVTLFDIAERAGVSYGTVSRALNGRWDVNKETAERVRRIAAELRYRPSHVAISLVRQRTDLIGVVFPAVTAGFYAELLSAISDEALRLGKHILAVFTSSNEDAREQLRAFVSGRRVDSLIVMNLGLDDAFIASLAEREAPLVQIDRPTSVRGVSSIVIDNAAGMKDLVNHLVSVCGHRRFAVIGGPAGTYDAEERMDVCRRALSERGIATADEDIFEGDFTEAAGQRAVESWMRAGRALPDVWVALNDATALGAIQALKEHGVRVPDDTAVTGFDDIHAARFVGLTTVGVPLSAIGETAVRFAVGERKPGHARLKPKLVVRESCGCRARLQ
jgi:LacI family transcriptional regulator